MTGWKLSVGATLLLVAGLSEPAAGADTLFAIQQDGAIAERLPYGPTAITESSSAFLNTQVGTRMHNRWRQRGVNGAGTVLYDIVWRFSTTKTVAQRFQDAVNTGEPVAWEVLSTPTAQLMSGVWRFSSEAGDLLSKFDGSSGANFVTDTTGNGIWGAGTGVIDGTRLPIFPGTLAGWAWGFGNLNGSDFFTPFPNSGTLVLDGVLQTTLPSGFKNLMYVGPIPGDYDGNGVVAAADYTVWRDAYGSGGAGLAADGNSDGVVNAADYTLWRDNVAGPAVAVPEPVGVVQICLMGLWLVGARKRNANLR